MDLAQNLVVIFGRTLSWALFWSRKWGPPQNSTTTRFVQRDIVMPEPSEASWTASLPSPSRCSEMERFTTHHDE
jgi:hypothetical protein